MKKQPSTQEPEICDICMKPQWVMPNGEHRCKSIEELQYQFDKDTELLHFWSDFAHTLQNQIFDLHGELKALKESTDPRNKS